MCESCSHQCSSTVSFWRLNLCFSISLNYLAFLWGSLSNNQIECNPVSSMEGLPDYKRWPVETLCLLLLGIIFIDPKNFHCTRFPYQFSNVPNFQPYISLLSPVIPSPLCHLDPSPAIHKVYFISPPRKSMHSPGPSLYNFSVHKDCTLVTIHLTASIHL